MDMSSDEANAEEITLLSAMKAEAEGFVSAFSWAPNISSSTLCFGVGGVIAIFLFKFGSLIGDTDDKLWVIVGDLPSAYLVVDEDDDPRQATERYCELMDDWCEAVEQGSDLSEVYPVDVPATSENSELLRKRISFIRNEILLDIPNENLH